MKKIRILSLALCFLVFLQCSIFTAHGSELTETISATDNTLPQEPTGEVSPIVPESELVFGTVSIYNGCRGLESQIPLSHVSPFLDTAQSVVLFERKTNTMVYSYNPDAKLSPGTLTKIVTALVAIENTKPDSIVTCSSRNISRLPAQTQHVDLKEGEQLTVTDLLHCLILHSANDAAIALSEFVSGNQQAFVTLMNDRVRRMGCTNTEFANVHGLDNQAQHTTARDMAIIMNEACKNDIFRELIGTKGYTVPETNRSDERVLKTTNYLIDERVVAKYYDERVTGGLASYSANSGASIVCTAEYGNMDYICVILASERKFRENGWSVLYYGNFDEMTELLEFAFGQFRIKRIIYEGQTLSQFPVIDGENQVVGQPHVNIDTVLPADVSMDNLILNIRPEGGELSAPVARDEKIAEVEIMYRTSCIAETELFAMSDVRREEDSGLKIQGDVSRDDDDTSGFLGFVKIVSAVILIPLAVYLVINTWLKVRAKNRKHRRRSGRRRSH